jgi:outer membrane protein assembly factor BamB
LYRADLLSLLCRDFLVRSLYFCKSRNFMRATSRFVIGSSVAASLLLGGALAPCVLAQDELPVVGPITPAPQEAPALPAPLAVPVPLAPVNGTSWTTFKGDNTRSGQSAANVTLPLTLKWRFSADAPPSSFNTSPLVLGAPGQQRVYFAAGRNIYCVDLQTGQQIWKTPNFTSSLATPLTLLSGEAGDLIIVAQQSGRVAALRTLDGGRAWETDALSSVGYAGPIVVNTSRGQRIISALNSGRLVAFTPEGTIDPEWKVSLPLTSPSSSMSLSRNGSMLFISGSDAKLYIIDVTKGTVSNSVRLPAISSVTPVVVGDQVVVSSGTRVSSYRIAGGSSAWEFEAGGLVLGSPAVATDAAGQTTLFFGTRNGVLLCAQTKRRTSLENRSGRWRHGNTARPAYNGCRGHRQGSAPGP